MVHSSHRVPVLAFVLGALVASVPLYAQEWSAEQKEAWAAELGYWKAYADEDIAGAMAFFHPDYRGWTYGDSLPSGNANTKTAWGHFFPSTETYFHEETPIAIVVRGNVAVIHYVASAHYKNEKGEHAGTEQRWTDTLVKEGGKWLLLGDHGGRVDLLKE